VTLRRPKEIRRGTKGSPRAPQGIPKGTKAGPRTAKWSPMTSHRDPRETHGIEKRCLQRFIYIKTPDQPPQQPICYNIFHSCLFHWICPIRGVPNRPGGRGSARVWANTTLITAPMPTVAPTCRAPGGHRKVTHSTKKHEACSRSHQLQPTKTKK